MDANTHAETASVVWMGARYEILLSAAGTSGAIGMFRSEDQPGFGPPMHVHHDADETFYVLDGAVDFARGDERLTVRAGGTVHIPRGTPHTFRVREESPARMLTILTPGGFEGFFAEVAAAGLEMPRDLPAMQPISEKFRLEFVGPPLGAQ
ncbi:cupin domain-containing protein [Pelagibacterium xiamenense]|uniref:cupin domain-containing protein n=1 Tax=Pelagibacterium xiamenense TaxID=2901140 RepID=UPI001E477B07|nr:cupin domain-containing protein [Pelagibacterium xiamenense]MCD7058641.1 cupin domain-containing protein [Pelagibacterium xiamenense]